MKWEPFDEKVVNQIPESQALWHSYALSPKEKLVRKAIQLLTPAQREVIILEFYLGCSRACIAQQLLISKDSISDCRNRALKRLEELLGPVLYPEAYPFWSPLLGAPKAKYHLLKVGS